MKTFLPNPFFSNVKPPQTANIFIELPTAEIGVECPFVWFPSSGLGTRIHEAPLRVLNEVIDALSLEAELREDTFPSRSLGTR